MSDPLQPNPYRAPAFGPADNQRMIPAGHVVLVVGLLLLLAPLFGLISGLLSGGWTPALDSHRIILTDVLLSLLLLGAVMLLGLGGRYSWERFGFWTPAGTDFVFVAGILAISFLLQPLFMFGFDPGLEEAAGLREGFFAAYHPGGVLVFELLVVLSLVVLTPLFEEIAFRGLIFGWARQRLGFVESALFSALVFAAFHSAYIDNLGPFWGLRAMAMIFTLGFLSALLFERTGSLIAPTALHALFNVQAVMPLLTEQPAA